MNLAKDALHVLGSVAPTIATAFGGPLAGYAVTAIEGALGPDHPVSQAKTAADKQKALEAALLGGDPRTLVALKKADQDFEARMAELGIERDKLVFNDLAGARSMQVQTKDPTVARLAWTIIGGFLVISLAQLVALVGFASEVNKVPPQGWLLIGNISGYLANEAKQVAAFYFGSSADSQRKTETLSEIAKS